jgi:hypothetical protein
MQDVGKKFYSQSDKFTIALDRSLSASTKKLEDEALREVCL